MREGTSIEREMSWTHCKEENMKNMIMALVDNSCLWAIIYCFCIHIRSEPNLSRTSGNNKCILHLITRYKTQTHIGLHTKPAHNLHTNKHSQMGTPFCVKISFNKSFNCLINIRRAMQMKPVVNSSQVRLNNQVKLTHWRSPSIKKLTTLNSCDPFHHKACRSHPAPLPPQTISTLICLCWRLQFYGRPKMCKPGDVVEFEMMLLTHFHRRAEEYQHETNSHTYRIPSV